MYIYVENKLEPRYSPAKYTVGFYRADGGWEPESDHASRIAAMSRMATLNGGSLAREAPTQEVEAHSLRHALP